MRFRSSEVDNGPQAEREDGPVREDSAGLTPIPGPAPSTVHGRYSHGLFEHTHSLAAFRGLPFEDIAVIGPRGGGKGKDRRWAAVFKAGWAARRGGCKQSEAEARGAEGKEAPRFPELRLQYKGARLGHVVSGLAVLMLIQVVCPCFTLK